MSDNFCWMCDSTQRTLGPLHYHNFTPDAAHRNTLISHEQYPARCVQERREPSHLFRCPGFRLEFLTVDSMHAGDLGTFQDAMGSLLWLEITNKQWHRNQHVGLQRLNELLTNCYGSHPDQGLSKETPLPDPRSSLPSRGILS